MWAIAEGSTPQDLSALSGVEAQLRREGFAYQDGVDMRALLHQPDGDDWASFAASWEDLGVDLYMADGGRYRRRRFAVFNADQAGFTRKPHQPHFQSRDYNPLNGGLQRWFEPVVDAVVTHAITQRILSMCATIFTAMVSKSDQPASWHVEMHQFRIEAVAGKAALPTPEGAHRDGVDWVCVMLVNRHNVASGITDIYDSKGGSLQRFTLRAPLDTVFVDDARVRHGVTPITPLDPQLRAFRDVLILTFRRQSLVS